MPQYRDSRLVREASFTLQPRKAGGSQGTAASSPTTLHPSSELPNSHHSQQPLDHKQLHPLNFYKQGRQILGAQRDPWPPRQQRGWPPSRVPDNGACTAQAGLQTLVFPAPCRGFLEGPASSIKHFLLEEKMTLPWQGARWLTQGRKTALM